MIALSSMLYFKNKRLESLEDYAEINSEKTPLFIQINLMGARDEAFTEIKSKPKYWLGESGNPFSEENKRMKKIGRNIIKKATGIDV